MEYLHSNVTCRYGLLPVLPGVPCTPHLEPATWEHSIWACCSALASYTTAWAPPRGDGSPHLPGSCLPPRLQVPPFLLDFYSGGGGDTGLLDAIPAWEHHDATWVVLDAGACWGHFYSAGPGATFLPAWPGHWEAGTSAQGSFLLPPLRRCRSPPFLPAVPAWACLRHLPA